MSAHSGGVEETDDAGHGGGGGGSDAVQEVEAQRQQANKYQGRQHRSNSLGARLSFKGLLRDGLHMHWRE